MANEMLFFLHATFIVFWLNIASIAVHSGERCGPWASGFLGGFLNILSLCHDFKVLGTWKLSSVLS